VYDSKGEETEPESNNETNSLIDEKEVASKAICQLFKESPLDPDDLLYLRQVVEKSVQTCNWTGKPTCYLCGSDKHLIAGGPSMSKFFKDKYAARCL
jgi:hypothetical protein